MQRHPSHPIPPRGRSRSLRGWALLGLPLLALTTACGGGEEGPAADATQAARNRDGSGGGSGGGTAAATAAIGVQPVKDTPVEALPPHDGHRPLPPGGPDAEPPGGPDFAGNEATRTWVVSPNGDD